MSANKVHRLSVCHLRVSANRPVPFCQRNNEQDTATESKNDQPTSNANYKLHRREGLSAPDMQRPARASVGLSVCRPGDPPPSWPSIPGALLACQFCIRTCAAADPLKRVEVHKGSLPPSTDSGLPSAQFRLTCAPIGAYQAPCMQDRMVSKPHPAALFREAVAGGSFGVANKAKYPIACFAMATHLDALGVPRGRHRRAAQSQSANRTPSRSHNSIIRHG